MAIPASHIVSVQPRVITAGSNDLEMNGLLLSRNDMISVTDMVLEFPSVSSVGEYFGINSDEYKAANIYFTGYQNKFSAPRAFFIARRVDEAVSAWLRGTPLAISIAELKVISSGSLKIKIDGAERTISNIDLSAATSLSNVAEIIEAAFEDKLSGVTCSYSSQTKAFTVISPTTGNNSDIGYAQVASNTELGALLGLTQEKGAVVSAGSDALSTDEQMSVIRAKTENWVTVGTSWEAEKDEMLALAAWANNNYGWMYVAWTTAATTQVQTSDTDPASALKEAGYDHTAIVYGSLEYAMFVMGAVASIAWQRTNGAITMAFKRQSGLAAWVNNEGTASVLEAKNCNYFGNFATRNSEFVFLYPGCLSASDYGFIDPYINAVWLNNRIQVALISGLSNIGRVPYNERGYTMIRSWMMDPVNDALNNAVIEPGISLSESQKSELINEAGLDISGELQMQGYYIQIKDPGAPARGRRESPVVSLWYTYGGAVQKIEIASTAVL